MYVGTGGIIYLDFFLFAEYTTNTKSKAYKLAKGGFSRCLLNQRRITVFIARSAILQICIRLLKIT